ncbi:MAG: UvrD-helicase domain-containing protein [Bdellovibrionaceae bacterium]|jgi:DNA helicase II / ATP-dependent DNA helicase PcrA|nr:UvrD-helicase domain-containing protein [Pseudobdellovibrionaceae bacterium]
MSELLFSNELNDVQLKAVHQTDGPLLILAGAGSGKTRVLTYRFANIIAQGHAASSQILCMTFTNKAASEMQLRINSLLRKLEIYSREPLWISTFHSFCVRILRNEIHYLGYDNYFAIYDQSDQLSQIKRIMKSFDIADKSHPAKNFQGVINRAKMNVQSPEDLEIQTDTYVDDLSIQVYRQYEIELKKSNALDFSDLLLKTHLLFKQFPDVLFKYNQQFKYIMVDEYQDTNFIQYSLIQQLTKTHHNLCVVGDEDQSIYSWRGADITNILNFEKDNPSAHVVKLEENYRSSKNIVLAASAVIANNTERKSKTLFTSNPEGELISIQEQETEYDEARFISHKIESLVSQDQCMHSEIAVFYRTNAQSRVIEDQLRSLSIPYKLIGGVKFYDRLEIKDILGYLKLVLNPKDNVAFRRVINVPTRGIGKTTVEKLEHIATEQGLSLLDSIQVAIDNKVVHSGAARKLKSFYELMQTLMGDYKRLILSELYMEVVEKSEYIRRLELDNSVEALSRIDNLEEFQNAIVQFESERGDESNLQNFLEEMALVSDVDDVDANENCVTLMTLHSSKGLEYPIVFVVGLEEGLFPSGISVDDGESAVEEERRLCYVGMTRAMKKLFLSYARQRRVWGVEQMNPPSRFLKEIPPEFVKEEGQRVRPKFMSKFSQSSSSAKNSYSNYNQSSSTDEYSQEIGFDDEFNQSTDFDDFYSDPTASLSMDFKKGMRVRHPTFGVGHIAFADGQGEKQKVGVVFPNKAMKTFVVKYARLEKL